MRCKLACRRVPPEGLDRAPPLAGAVSLAGARLFASLLGLPAGGCVRGRGFSGEQQEEVCGAARVPGAGVTVWQRERGGGFCAEGMAAAGGRRWPQTRPPRPAWPPSLSPALRAHSRAPAALQPSARADCDFSRPPRAACARECERGEGRANGPLCSGLRARPPRRAGPPRPSSARTHRLQGAPRDAAGIGRGARGPAPSAKPAQPTAAAPRALRASALTGRRHAAAAPPRRLSAADGVN